MEARLLGSLGKVSGLAGLVVGVSLLIFRDILTNAIIPAVGLDAGQAFTVVMVMMILTFGLAGVGIVGWYVAGIKPDGVVPTIHLGFLAFLIISVLAAAVFLGQQAATKVDHHEDWKPLVAANCWLFERGTADLVDDERIRKASLERARELLSGFSSIAVEGEFQDPQADRDYRLIMVERRANVVKDALVAAGIIPEKILTISYGKEKTAAFGSDIPIVCGARMMGHN